MSAAGRAVSRAAGAGPALLALDPFVLRQWKAGSGSFVDFDQSEFLARANSWADEHGGEACMAEGYADFCKHIFVPNFTPMRLSTVDITARTEPLIRTSYEACVRVRACGASRTRLHAHTHTLALPTRPGPRKSCRC